jgi:16S rRNA (uracil1498-N3)-methyltransferase
MRAHWERSLEILDEYTLRDDSLHHLVNVARIDQGESLILLNGNGLIVETVVEVITKKEIRLRKTNHYVKDRPFHLDLVLGMPKREALELCIKEATELGFHTIYLIKSDYSQMRFPETERLNKLLISALEQSNSPFMPMVLFVEIKDVPWESYSQALLMDSQSQKTFKKMETSSAKKVLIVGPEGGFSSAELSFLHSLEMVHIICLPTPILRTPTAVATGAGIVIQSLLY